MKKFTITSLNNLHVRIKGNCLCVNLFIIFCFLFFSSNALSQAGDISQIRNGSGAAILNNQKQIIGYDSCGTCWVNGNAGSTNAHYTEGMSIAYRSVLTGLEIGKCYEYELGYDTYHGAMAIDYLTHFQRLEPHGPFGHDAEVIKPLLMTSGSSEYLMTVVTGGFDTYAIPEPSISGISSGVFDKNGNPKDVSQQAKTSFNALPAAQRLMTMYNGDITFMYYVSEAAIVLGGADAETRIRVRFTAKSDSAVLAWGGHIGSRLDWGYTKDNKGKLIPLSAGGISGSPYHMRQKAMDSVNCNTGVVINNISGFGNQDRSLSAAAVNPPPECNLSGPVIACPETALLTYSTTVTTGVTYQWELINNSANAIINGSSTGSSINVTPNPNATTADFTPGGTFNVKLTTTANFISTICYLGGSTEPGTNVVITNVNVSATASSNTTPTPATYDGVLDRAIGSTSNLNAVGSNGTAAYAYKWSDAGNTNGSFSNENIANPVYTVTGSGDFFVKVVVTDATGCKDSVTLKILVVANTPPCKVTGPTTVCPGSANTYKYDPDENGVADAIPTNFTAVWTLENNTNNASIPLNSTGNTVVVTSLGGLAKCNTAYRIKITLTSTSETITTSCFKDVDVKDIIPPTITNCPADVTLNCLTADVTPAATGGPATATDNCSAIVTFNDVTTTGCYKLITRTWTATDPCGNTATCVQRIIVHDVTAPVFNCTATGTPTVSDNCTATNAIVVFSRDAGTTRTWTAIDQAGNIGTCTQTISSSARIATTAPEEAASNVSAVKTSAPIISGKKISTLPQELKVNAYPNPYNTSVNFEFVSPISGALTLEVYDLLGRRLGLVFSGNVAAGAQKIIAYKVPAAQNTVMIYKLKIGDRMVNGKLLPAKTNFKK